MRNAMNWVMLAGLASLSLTGGVFGGDREAGDRMAAAHKARAAWGSKFPGFSAKLELNLDGKTYSGTTRVSPTGDTHVEMDNEEAAGWAKMWLASTVQHRSPGEDWEYSEDEYAKYRFADSDKDHPLGRLIAAADSDTHTTYRVRDNQILEVSRDVGKQRFTISVLENIQNREGKYLPRSYSVAYWDSASGKIERVTVTRDEWKRVGEFDLPAGATVVTTSDGKRSVRRIMLSDHRLGESDKTAAQK